MTVLIAGAGIAGLSCALTCHQIGVPFKIFETVQALKPLGVGINLQPNAVRELFDLGLADDLSKIGVETREYGMFSKKGLEIWTEPRGRWAGYKWPQYSIHRGALQMLLHQTLIERAGPHCVQTGWRAVGFTNENDAVRLHLVSTANGSTRSEAGDLLIGADGTHSAVRAQIVPDEGPPVWGGAILWRATTRAVPFRTGASMALIGHATQRLVAYPISAPDPDSGLVAMNWIAELTYDPSAGWNREDWNREADKNAFLPAFEDWRFGWIDVPELVNGARKIFEYPMVDRDPVERWTDGRATLMGDAAHPTYPVGSNGASQAIIDARKLGACLLDHGLRADALEAYEDEIRPATTRIVLTNRGSGPDAVLQLIEDRCGGSFDHIDDVTRPGELADHAAKYKAIAGFGIEALNALPRTIPDGARVQIG